MSLAEGGHLTHGMPLNMSGKWFNVVSYGLNGRKRSTTTRWSAWPTSTSRS
jgi:glycine/serine hydroxymethyltransferase